MKPYKSFKSTNKDTNVFVMTPARQAIEGKTVLDLIAMMMSAKAPASFVYYEGTYLNQVREGMIQLAIDNGASHILFIDSDMRFPPETLDVLLEPDLDVVACNYASRTQPGKPVAYIGLEPYYCKDSDARYNEVETVGMGVALLKTSIFKDIPQPRCVMPWDSEAKMFIGEDVYLCHAIREAGFHIFVDNKLSLEVKHIGTTELDTI